MITDPDLRAIEDSLPSWTRELLPCLGVRQRQVFALRSTGLTFDKIGVHLGFSDGRASQLHATAVGALTAPARRGAQLTLHASSRAGS